MSLKVAEKVGFIRKTAETRLVKDLNGIPGCESFHICLTGYQRPERDDIMRMVEMMGAHFSKPLVATKVTHLICYKFEGDKYELAKRVKTIKLVNHRWLEDCLKAWEILPTDNYNKSGYELEILEVEARDSEEETEEDFNFRGMVHRNNAGVSDSVSRQPIPRSPEMFLLVGEPSNQPQTKGSPIVSEDVCIDKKLSSTPFNHLNCERSLNFNTANMDEFDHQGLENSLQFGKDGAKVGLHQNIPFLSGTLTKLTKEGNITPPSVRTAGSPQSESTNKKLGSLSYARKNSSGLSLVEGSMSAPRVPPAPDHLEENRKKDDVKLSSPESKPAGSYPKSPEIQTTGDLEERYAEESTGLPQKRKVGVSGNDSVSPASRNLKSCVPQSSFSATTASEQFEIYVTADATPSKTYPSTTSRDNPSMEVAMEISTSDQRGKPISSKPVSYQKTLAKRKQPSAGSKNIGNTCVTSDVKVADLSACGPRSISDKHNVTNSGAPGLDKVYPSGEKLDMQTRITCSATHLEELAIESRSAVEVSSKPDIPMKPVDDKMESGQAAKSSIEEIQTGRSSEVAAEEIEPKKEQLVPESRDSEIKRIPVAAKPSHLKKDEEKKMGCKLYKKVVATKNSSFGRKTGMGKMSDGKASMEVDKPLLANKAAACIEKDKEVVHHEKENGTRTCELSSPEMDIDMEEHVEEKKVQNEQTLMDEEKENQPITNDALCLNPSNHENHKLVNKSNIKLKQSDEMVGVTDLHSRTARNEPAWFILSGHRLQRKEFQKIIRRLRGRFCRDSHQWSYQATHFVVPDPVRRTEKFFAAAASGRWILKTDYLAASSQAGKFLEEEPFEWHQKGLSEDGAINLEAPRKWRLLRQRTGHGAFHGMRIIVYGECIAPPLETLKRVVKAGDGVILATSPPYTRFLSSGVDFAIVSPGMLRMDSWVQEFLRHEIPCVVPDYLVEYMCKPGYSLERHVLYNTHAWAEKSFANMLSRSEEIVEPTLPSEQAEEDISCVVCGSRDREEVMLICGDQEGAVGCGVATHIDCCDPPLKVVPDEDWFCSSCSKSSSSGRSTVSSVSVKGGTKKGSTKKSSSVLKGN
ncbi:BRCT domain-containing protein [Acorus calamus]|uniref:BRCT domain-containing protein n=1 Tax=Acorus calamus TaxID=4465 RepID=A0AAV9EX51_ACOCL|nr:BRCT domain-containing protein [Acorus calamus]